MEELQDAIEDAQYVNAIATQEEGPRPVLAWEFPNEEQLAEWCSKLKANAGPEDPVPFGVDWTLSSAIGLFLFSAYLKESCDDYLRINFVEEIIRWRRLKGKYRVERARKIIQVYLKEPPVDPDTGGKVLPQKTQIDEYDLCRAVLKMELTKEEFETAWTLNMDASNSKNCLGLNGPVLKELFQAVKEMEKAIMAQQRRSTSSQASATEPPKESGDGGSVDPKDSLKTQKEKYTSLRLSVSLKEKDAGSLPDNLFDMAEAIVVESLRKQYWEGFVASEYYSKLRNFLWFQDRAVVPDDFFTMRVLGRGGFGLVTGERVYVWRRGPCSILG
jgi:hypothetical protein